MKNKQNDHISIVNFYQKLYYLWFKYRKKWTLAGIQNCSALKDDLEDIVYNIFILRALSNKIFLSARIAKLAETFNYWSQINLDVTESVRLLLDTKVLKRNLGIF